MRKLKIRLSVSEQAGNEETSLGSISITGANIADLADKAAASTIDLTSPINRMSPTLVSDPVIPIDETRTDRCFICNHFKAKGKAGFLFRGLVPACAWCTNVLRTAIDKEEVSAWSFPTWLRTRKSSIASGLLALPELKRSKRSKNKGTKKASIKKPLTFLVFKKGSEI